MGSTTFRQPYPPDLGPLRKPSRLIRGLCGVKMNMMMEKSSTQVEEFMYQMQKPAIVIILCSTRLVKVKLSSSQRMITKSSKKVRNWDASCPRPIGKDGNF